MEKDWTYSDDGPLCPYCGHRHIADDPAFFDPDLMTEITCDSCDKTFDVEVEQHTSWTCATRK
jgi:transcription elongation factor Elf1